MAGFPATFVALAVVLLLLVPGAIFLLAYGARVGQYGVNLPDRLFRFITASAIFQALFVGLNFALYKTFVKNGRLALGNVSAWTVELYGVLYVAVPLAVGIAFGYLVRRNLLGARALATGSVDPRAWDHLFAGQKPNGVIRAKLKSGKYIAGLFGCSEDRRKRSYAGGYPESSDLLLYMSLAVDAETGKFEQDDGGSYIPGGGSLLVRWEEIEFLEIFDSE